MVKFMQKNVNVGLLTLVVVIVLFMAAVTIYYQSTYDEISTDFRTKLGELEKTKTALMDQQSQLNQTSEELELKMQREQALSGLYQNVTSQNDDLIKLIGLLERKLHETSESLNTTLVEWQDAVNEANDAKAKYEEEKTKYEEVSSKAATYSNLVTQLSEVVSSLGTNIGLYVGNQDLGAACVAAMDDVDDHFTSVDEKTEELKNV